MGVLFAVIVSFVYQASPDRASRNLLRLGRSFRRGRGCRSTTNGRFRCRIAAFSLNGPLWFHGSAELVPDAIDRRPARRDDARRRSAQLLVLDARRIDDIDFTGAEALSDGPRSLRCGMCLSWWSCSTGRTQRPSRSAGSPNCWAGHGSSTPSPWRRGLPNLAVNRQKGDRTIMHPPEHGTFDLRAHQHRSQGFRAGGRRIPLRPWGLYMARRTPGRVPSSTISRSWLLPAPGLEACARTFSTSIPATARPGPLSGRRFPSPSAPTVGRPRDHYLDLVVADRPRHRMVDVDRLLRPTTTGCCRPRRPKRRCAPPSGAVGWNPGRTRHDLNAWLASTGVELTWKGVILSSSVGRVGRSITAGAAVTADAADDRGGRGRRRCTAQQPT